MLRFTRALVVVVGGLAAVSSTAAPPGGDPGRQLEESVLQAYRATRTYHAKVSFTMRQQGKRTTVTQEAWYGLVFDRDAGRFLLDRPDYKLASDGAKLRLQADQFPGRHLELDAPAKLDYAALAGAIPVLENPMSPDLVWLLSDDPVAALAETAGARAKVLSDNAAPGRRGLQFADKDGQVWSLWFNDKTHLLDKVVVDMDAAGPADQSMTLTYDFQVLAHNQPADPKLLALALGPSQPVGSLQALVAGGGGGGGPQQHPLLGKAAPPVDLPNLDGSRYKLADDKATIVILDFWASWCGPCRVGLPKLQNAAAWAAKEKKPVAVYTVNVQESAEQAKAFVAQTKLALPVLLDGEGKVAMAYQVGAIPQTVFIVDGKVAKVHVGLPPGDPEEALRGDIEALLQPASAAGAAATQPAP